MSDEQPAAHDPEYRIAYDVDHCKVGCVLIQVALGGDLPSKLFYDPFGTGEAWTVDAGTCKIYKIRRSQLPLLVAKTSFDRDDGDGALRQMCDELLGVGSGGS